MLVLHQGGRQHYGIVLGQLSVDLKSGLSQVNQFEEAGIGDLFPDKAPAIGKATDNCCFIKYFVLQISLPVGKFIVYLSSALIIRGF
ncbi:MAG: hypothetical protein KME25_22375 [Symplocastrum torsivum CPER-KK1]|jgi:hypothetical protein|uniref:Uncharacterized protein n=1 Tax=Symplocastrum torsivum CPER-KK1 TaxID=450513 RepID=A0A951PPV3_9CYAN|nr:hypothetical protein [Symplocastrum torsivum CPER-KK1]